MLSWTDAYKQGLRTRTEKVSHPSVAYRISQRARACVLNQRVRGAAPYRRLSCRVFCKTLRTFNDHSMGGTECAPLSDFMTRVVRNLKTLFLQR